MNKTSIFAATTLFLLTISVQTVFSQATELQILHTNDVHGRILPFELGISDYHKEVGGVARRATLINTLKKDNKNQQVLLLDAGDVAQGTIFFNLYSGKPDIKYMNMLNYDAMTIGNHEFDKGSQVLSKMIEEAEFSVLAANLDFDKDSPLYGKVKPYLIKEYDTLKVGIIGLLTEEVKIISNIGKHTKVLDPIKTANKYIKKIDKDTDVIILLTHLGFENDKALANGIENADIIIGGHSHTFLACPAIVNDKNGHPIIVLQVGDFGKYLGDLKVKVNNDEVEMISYNTRIIDASIKPDKAIELDLQDLNKEFTAVASQIIGSTATHINLIRDEVRTKETTGGNFFADSIKYKYPEVDIVLQNGGAIRSDRIISPGNISLADIMEIHPFDNEVILFDLSGKDLKSALERSVSNLPYSSGGFLQVSGLTFTADVSKQPQTLTDNYMQIKEEGKRIYDIQVNGRPLEDNKLYRVASNIFLLNGGNGYWALKNGAQNVEGTGLTLTQVLVDYLKSVNPIAPKVENRIKIINTPKKRH
jgi:5'-nucleotidase